MLKIPCDFVGKKVLSFFFAHIVLKNQYHTEQSSDYNKIHEEENKTPMFSAQL